MLMITIIITTIDIILNNDITMIINHMFIIVIIIRGSHRRRARSGPEIRRSHDRKSTPGSGSTSGLPENSAGLPENGPLPSSAARRTRSTNRRRSSTLRPIPKRPRHGRMQRVLWTGPLFGQGIGHLVGLQGCGWSGKVPKDREGPKESPRKERSKGTTIA